MENLQVIYDVMKFTEEQKIPEIVNEYDQEIPQSQTADNLMAP